MSTSDLPGTNLPARTAADYVGLGHQLDLRNLTWGAEYARLGNDGRCTTKER